MNTSTENLDELEKIIYNEDIRIRALHIHKELDLMLIVLNTSVTFSRKLSSYPLLKDASESQLNNYLFIGKGTGIHWPDIDEYLSLKGFLKEEIKYSLNTIGTKLAA